MNNVITAVADSDGAVGGEGGLHDVTGAVAEGDRVVIASCNGHRVTGAIAEGECVVVDEAGAHVVLGAVAEGDYVVSRDVTRTVEDLHQITGAVAEGNCVVAAAGGVDQVTGAVAKGDCVVAAWGRRSGAMYIDHVTGAVAKGDCVVAAEGGVDHVPVAIAEGDCVRLVLLGEDVVTPRATIASAGLASLLPLTALLHFDQKFARTYLGAEANVGGAVDHEAVFGLPRVRLRRNRYVADAFHFVDAVCFGQRALGCIVFDEAHAGFFGGHSG